MATYKHLRSSTANKRPTTSIADGQLAINTNTASPGLFFKDSAGTGIVKVGPVHVGTTAPNSVPASGGSTGNYLGEQWLDTSVSPAQMKVWNGSTWVGVVADELPVSKLQDGAARQLIQTDAAGTGVEWTSNVDVPGTLDVTSTATFDSIAQHPLGSAAAPTLTFTGDNNTGIYSPGADQVAISTGALERARIDSSGRLLVGTTSTSTTATAVFQGNSGGATSHGIINLARGATNPGVNLSLGFTQFQDAAGSVGAQIYAQTDVAWSAGSYASRLVFSTTADGASSPTERVRIDSRGAVRTGNNTLYTGTTGAVTASTGTTVFTFDFSGTTTRHTALVKLSVMHLVATNSIAAQPGAEYIFAVEGYSTGVSAATTPTAAFQNVYVAATHFAFADTGNTSFTITLTNPSASAASAVYYKVEVLDNAGALNLSSVTTT